MSGRWARKVDANQAAIVETLRRFGFSVCILARIGKGVPDLLVGGLNRNTNTPENVLVEVKSSGGYLTPDELDFRNEWRGQPVLIAYGAEAVLSWFGIED